MALHASRDLQETPGLFQTHRLSLESPTPTGGAVAPVWRAVTSGVVVPSRPVVR